MSMGRFLKFLAKLLLFSYSSIIFVWLFLGQALTLHNQKHK